MCRLISEELSQELSWTGIALSANRNTIKAMEQRGLITPAKGHDALTIV
jgi:hypothetical protein